MKIEEIMSQLRWDLTPQNASINEFINLIKEGIERLNKLLAEKAGYYFYIDVWNCQAHLALMHNRANGGGTMHQIEDFNSPLLEKAVEAVGSITTSGWYPLSKQLVNLLKKKLEVQ